MAKSFEMDMTEGPLLRKIVLYALPLIATNVLQLLFNAMDVAVLGMFAPNGDAAVAAVGSTGALINLIIGLFVGLSVGVNVLIARCVGRKDADQAKRIVGMSIFVSIIVGIVLLVVGVCFARTFLEWMSCDPAVIDMAVKYLTIYFLGMPIMMLYNYSAAILRAVGDTLRPLIFLLIGGVVNVGLNILFVVGFGKDVEGVAIATVVAQGISAILCIITMRRATGYCRYEYKYTKIYLSELWQMIKIGVPAGLQGCVFSLSNVIIQSTVNGFGVAAMAGNTIASQMDGFIYNAANAVSLSALAFVSQNYGAGKYDRIKKSVALSIMLSAIVCIVLGLFMIVFRYKLCGIMTSDKEVLEIAAEKLLVLSSTYFLCGIMDTLSNCMRGLGKSTTAMVVSLSGSCLFRILWLKTFYLLKPSLMMIYLVYPASWILTIAIFLIMYTITIKKVKKILTPVNM